MNRKDTIIIAVLINAGLLAVLFMLAINTEETIKDASEIHQALVDKQGAISPPQQTPVPVMLRDSASVDEVDNFLKELASSEYSHSPFVDDDSGVDLETEIAASENIILEQSKIQTPAVQTAGSSQFVEISIKRGDALEKIARANGTTIEAIKKANHLSSSKLTIGQILRIPLSDKSLSKPLANPATPSIDASSNQPKVAAAKSPAGTEPQYYTIKSGDNPWKIAKQYQVKFDELLKLNDLDNEKARALKVGDKIRVR